VFPNFRKCANFRLPLKVQKQKVLQLQGASPPWPTDQVLCPWTPLGAPPPDPHYRLVLHALAMPPLPNPKYATACVLPVYRSVFACIYMYFCLNVMSVRFSLEPPARVDWQKNVPDYWGTTQNILFSESLKIVCGRLQLLFL